MISPLISVIIPTYNRGNLVLRAINSVLNQTYNNLELIIIDDASTDNTGEVINKIQDKRIKYFKNVVNLGGGAARNIGIKLSKGTLIAFLDSDDEWIKEKLQKQVNYILNHWESCDLVFCGVRAVKESGSKKTILSETLPDEYGNIYNKIFLGIPPACLLPGLLVKKDKILNAGLFDEKFKSSQDWDLLIRLAKICYVGSIPEILLIIYYHNQTKITGDPKNLIQGRELLINKYWYEIKNNRQILNKHYKDLLIFSLHAKDKNRLKYYFKLLYQDLDIKQKLLLSPFFTFSYLPRFILTSLLKLKKIINIIFYGYN